MCLNEAVTIRIQFAKDKRSETGLKTGLIINITFDFNFAPAIVDEIEQFGFRISSTYRRYIYKNQDALESCQTDSSVLQLEVILFEVD